MDSPVLTIIIHELYDAQILKFGEFTLKDGSKSSYYLDLRLLVSYPKLLNKICRSLSLLCRDIRDSTQHNYHIAGVPLAGVPIATLVSYHTGWPGLLIRKEAKEYGCKRAIEGKYTTGDKVILIDDVLTSGASKQETISVLQDHYLQCSHVVVIVDRRSDCTQQLDFTVTSLLTVSNIVQVLLQYSKVTAEDRLHLEHLAHPTT